MKKLVFLCALIIFGVQSHAQLVRGPIGVPAPGVLNGVYVPATVPTKKVIQYEHVREADVTWSKRVWSVIDLRQKFNHPLFYPMDEVQEGMWNKNLNVWSMWTIIRYHVLHGDLTVYSPFNPEWETWTDGDSFKYPVTPSKAGGNYFNDSLFREDVFIYLGTEVVDPFAPPLKSMVDPTEDSVIYNPITQVWEAVYPAADTSWFLSQDIVQYKIKEDWFFDKERSQMDRRIIGIAPVVHQKDVNGNVTGLRELFWLYFPECRYVFQNFFLKNRHNDAQWMSLDDLFWKRMFQSYIVKESNLYNRNVDSYKAGVDALLESEAIKAQINNFEHDLWMF